MDDGFANMETIGTNRSKKGVCCDSKPLLFKFIVKIIRVARIPRVPKMCQF